MTAFLDTSVILRYLTGDPPEIAARAARIIDATEEVYVTDRVIAETAYVLRTFYRLPREVVIDQLTEFIRKASISLYHLDKRMVIQGLQYCRPSGRVSVPDALTWATARSSGITAIYSFDERFPGDGVELLRERT